MERRHPDTMDVPVQSAAGDRKVTRIGTPGTFGPVQRMARPRERRPAELC